MQGSALLTCIEEERPGFENFGTTSCVVPVLAASDLEGRLLQTVIIELLLKLGCGLQDRVCLLNQRGSRQSIHFGSNVVKRFGTVIRCGSSGRGGTNQEIPQFISLSEKTGQTSLTLLVRQVGDHHENNELITLKQLCVCSDNDDLLAHYALTVGHVCTPAWWLQIENRDY